MRSKVSLTHVSRLWDQGFAVRFPSNRLFFLSMTLLPFLPSFSLHQYLSEMWQSAACSMQHIPIIYRQEGKREKERGVQVEVKGKRKKRRRMTNDREAHHWGSSFILISLISFCWLHHDAVWWWSWCSSRPDSEREELRNWDMRKKCKSERDERIFFCLCVCDEVNHWDIFWMEGEQIFVPSSHLSAFLSVSLFLLISYFRSSPPVDMSARVLAGMWGVRYTDCHFSSHSRSSDRCLPVKWETESDLPVVWFCLPHVVAIVSISFRLSHPYFHNMYCCTSCTRKRSHTTWCSWDASET